MLKRCSSRLQQQFGYMPHAPVLTNPVVFLDIACGQSHLGRVTIELFADVVPRTAENFRSLCTGERGVSRHVNVNGHSDSCPLTYKGIPFHRIVRDFIVQGGDILHKDGRGNLSIFGYPFFDESFEGKAGQHLSGTVAMATSGPNENGSQFFFNLNRARHLDGKFVVVGQVVDGWGIVAQMAKCGSRNGTPTKPCWVTECGQSGGEATAMEDLETVAAKSANRRLKDADDVLAMLRPRA
jgi:cyclophilin family peptidyl-prolyl cis-trans isomerase